jgi:hypothetical protein
MKKKNGLFELIKALTPAERRHFIRSFPTEKNTKKYLHLFREIEKMTAYDETKIKTKFKNERFTHQLHVIKIYLQENILKSLRSYHSSTSITIQIKDMLKNVEIYFGKELFNHCALEIQKAEKLALKYEDEVALMELLNWKRKLAQYESPGAFDVTDIVNDQSVLLSRMTYHNKLWKILATGLPHDLHHHEVEATLASTVLYHHIGYRTAIQHNRNDEARGSLEKLLEVLEKYPHRIQEDPALYLSTINNLISFLVFSQEYDAALTIIAKAKSFYGQIDSNRRRKNDFRMILRTYNIELEIYRDTESLDSASQCIQEIQSILNAFKEKVPYQYLISLWFQFAYIFFLRKEFKSSLHWINEILNSSFAEHRKDLHLQAHLLNLMLHLELRNFFVMRYFVGSATRFFKRNKTLKPYHQVLLSFFTRISAVPEGEHRPIFEKLSFDLFGNQNAIPANELDYINWGKWIGEKVGSPI